ncbi:MAG: hypothetical protein SWZ49_23775, partial [Cyanobacteriota bacterium]|nr:hypothetical protein [Cyanobacteriota bacterium]
MTVRDKAIAKINNLPDYLVEEVNDFIDYLRWKHEAKEASSWLKSEEFQKIAESDFSSYLSNLVDYENGSIPILQKYNLVVRASCSLCISS